MNITAKNLLEDKICEKCKFYEFELGLPGLCVIDRQLDSNPYLGTKPIPEENTCERWEESPHKDLRVSIQALDINGNVLKILR